MGNTNPDELMNTGKEATSAMQNTGGVQEKKAQKKTQIMAQVAEHQARQSYRGGAIKNNDTLNPADFFEASLGKSRGNKLIQTLTAGSSPATLKLP